MNENATLFDDVQDGRWFRFGGVKMQKRADRRGVPHGIEGGCVRHEFEGGEYVELLPIREPKETRNGDDLEARRRDLDRRERELNEREQALMALESEAR